MVAVALLFLILGDERRRWRVFLLISPAPLGLLIPALLSMGRGGSRDVILYLIFFGLALSLSLCVVGATLLARARRLKETRGTLAVGLLLAALPFILFCVGEYLNLVRF